MNDPLDHRNLPQISPLHNETQADQLFSVSELLSISRKHLRLISAIMVAGLALSLAAAFVVDEEFTSSVTVLIDPPSQKLVEMDALETSESTKTNGFVDSQVQLIKAPRISQNVIDKLDIMEKPRILTALGIGDKPAFWSPAYIKTLFGLGDDPAEPQFSELEDDELFDAEAVARTQVSQAIQGALKVTRVGLSNVLKVSFTSKKPSVSALLANALVDTYLVEQRASQMRTLETTSGWLDEKINELREDVLVAERKVEAFRSANGLFDVMGNSLMDQRRADISRELVRARTELAAAEARLRQVNDLTRDGGDIQTVAEVLSSDAILNLRREQASLTRKRAELMARYGDKHPSVVNVAAELNDVRAQLTEEAERILINIRNQVAVASANVSAMTAEQTKLVSEAEIDDDARITLRELQREANSTRAIYENLLDGYKTGFVVNNAAALGQVAEVVSKAQMPIAPSFPNKPLFLMVGLVLSALVATAIVLLLELTNNTAKSMSQLEQKTGLTPLVGLPRIKKSEWDSEDMSLYVRRNPMTHYTETLRKLKSSIAISRIDSPPQVILLTSPLPSEGKTHTSLGLAGSYVGEKPKMGVPGEQAEKTKVLVVDCDLRKPAVHKRIPGAHVEPGLLQYMQGEATLDDVIQPSDSGVDFLLNAESPSHSADILASAAMRNVITELRKRYDYIILDSAPVLPIIDTAMICRVADAVILCTRWGSTPIGAVKQADRILRSHSANLLGVVLTDVDPDAHSGDKYSAYGYDDYGYSKKYQNYYTKKS